MAYASIPYTKGVSEGVRRILNRENIKTAFKVPINPKIMFSLNKSLYNSEQNGAKMFDFGQNRNFL